MLPIRIDAGLALASAARDGRREIMVSDIAEDVRPEKRLFG